MKSLALPLTRWRSRSDKRDVARSPNAAKAALPMELWDIIIREIADEDVLRMSAVCSAFNAFAISEYLARNNISPAAKEISGPAYLIHPLQLSCVPLLVEHLVCHFRHFDVRRDLSSLQQFVPRAQSLRSLKLSFGGSLLRAHQNDRIPVEYSSRELMGTFCRVLFGMARKAAGPVVVVGQFGMFMCRAEEIAGWRLDALQFNPVSERNALTTRIRGTSTTITLRTTMRIADTPPREVFMRAEVLNDLRTVNVWVHDAPGVTYTMLVFNISDIKLLDLADSTIPDEQLTAVLRDLTLPSLRILNISRSSVDPTALGGFLARHPKLQEFTSLAPKPSSPLISSPLAHPQLSRIEATGTDNICLAMDALHFSPLLCTFVFTLTHDAANSLNNLSPAFRLLSQRSLNAHLKLTIFESPDNPSSMDEPLFDDEAAPIARALHCVYSVVISCSSTDVGIRTLPWLILLPNLLRVKFLLKLTGKNPRHEDPYLIEDSWPDAELKRLKRELDKNLAHVQNLSAQRCP
ncbi:hypothetical protein B0H16DRAFT_1888547 [Mycena metata]|uniref:F-box domain-containing protein n=1 Tax=Mycena metata TaxID=1033252 RepID=A0AAD7ISI8_9AGAR|nr:hypothetical protein B0H16DRAFT_1888547 [Mycena metata]